MTSPTTSFAPDPKDPKYLADQKAAEEKAKRDKADYEKKIADGQKKVEDLTDRFGPWYYVTPGRELPLDQPRPRRRVKPKKPPGGSADWRMPGGFPGRRHARAGFRRPACRDDRGSDRMSGEVRRPRMHEFARIESRPQPVRDVGYDADRTVRDTHTRSRTVLDYGQRDVDPVRVRDANPAAGARMAEQPDSGRQAACALGAGAEPAGRAGARLGDVRLAGLQHRQPGGRRDRGPAPLADHGRRDGRRPASRAGAQAAREDRDGREGPRHLERGLRRARPDADQGQRARRRCAPRSRPWSRSSAAGSSTSAPIS